MTALSGDDIITIIDKKQVELVLFDSSLSSVLLSSPEISQKLNGGFPVIVLQSGSSENTIRGLVPAAILTKPVPLDLLCREVKRLLKRDVTDIIEKVEKAGNLEILQEAVSDVAERVRECIEPNQIEELARVLEVLAASFRRWAQSRSVVSETVQTIPGKDTNEEKPDTVRVPPLPENQFSLFEVQIVCPICRAEFSAMEVDMAALCKVKVDPDGYTEYRELNPLFFEILVCPVCLYAARNDDFPEPETRMDVREKISRERVGRKKMVGYLDFANERSLKHGIASFLLSASCYRHYRDRDFVGDLFLRASWLCRELKDEQAEKEYLQRALENFLAAYESKAKTNEAGSRSALCYIIGEILVKLDRAEESLEYFDQVIKGEVGPIGPDLLKTTRTERASAQGTMKKKGSTKRQKRNVTNELEDEVL